METVTRFTTKSLQLDSVRGIAILTVMMGHWVSLHQYGYRGGYGVRCFFVISGFLMTGILLKLKQDQTRKNLLARYQNFQLRRILRIYPLYFLLLLVVSLIGVGGVKSSIPWGMTFTMNVLTAVENRWVQPCYHLWSLSTQEQFYLVWPLVILLASEKWLPRILLSTILAGFLLRLVFAYYFDPGHIGLKVLTPTTMDALALGGWMAWMRSQKGMDFICNSFSLKVIGWVGLIGTLLVTGFLHRYPGHPLEGLLFAFELSAQALASYWLVAHAASGATGALGFVLNLKVLQYLGKISFGLYLFHPLCDLMVRNLLEAHGLQMPSIMGARFVTSFAATLVVTIPCYYWLELPLARLKDRLRPHAEANVVMERKAA